MGCNMPFKTQFFGTAFVRDFFPLNWSSEVMSGEQFYKDISCMEKWNQGKWS